MPILQLDYYHCLSLASISLAVNLDIAFLPPPPCVDLIPKHTMSLGFGFEFARIATRNGNYVLVASRTPEKLASLVSSDNSLRLREKHKGVIDSR